MQFIQKLPNKIFIIVLIIFILSCTSEDLDNNDASENLPVNKQLQMLIDEIISQDDTVPGVVLNVSSPEVDFLGVSGKFEIDGADFKTDDVFRAASVTKTLTSAAIHVLEENGDLNLDDTIDNYLSSATVTALSNGGYQPTSITIRQLLNHTAGFYDYTNCDEYYAAIRANPTNAWTRADQISYAMNEGGKCASASKLNDPGVSFSYGDTQYILAGEIIENTTGKNLNEAFEVLLQLSTIGLSRTWMETIGSEPFAGFSDLISHPYIGSEDTRGWDASWDLWGGGGLATTAEDLMLFTKALFTVGTDGIFKKQATLDSFLTIPNEGIGNFFGMDGGYGINRFSYDGIGDCYAGFGFFTTIIVHCPEADIYYTGTANQSEPEEPNKLLEDVLGILSE